MLGFEEEDVEEEGKSKNAVLRESVRTKDEVMWLNFFPRKRKLERLVWSREESRILYT